MIELVNVGKAYRPDSGEVRALDDVTLSVAPGEFVTVRGPSGSGKSTLLLTIGGMIRPTEGRVLLEGQDVYMMASRQRARLRADTIGFVFQMFYLVRECARPRLSRCPHRSPKGDRAAHSLTACGSPRPSARRAEHW